MKKTIKIGKTAFVSLLLVIALCFSGCRNVSVPFTGDTGDNEKSERALRVYTEAVQKLKNEKNFELKLTTSFKIDEIHCSTALVDTLLKKFFEFKFGSIEEKVDHYKFSDGVLTTDKTIVPANVVQPVNSEISEDLFNGIVSSHLYGQGEMQNISFVIGQEETSIDEIVKISMDLRDKVGKDFSGYDIRNSYPEVDAIAKYHSNFVDIMSVMSRLNQLMRMNMKAEEDEPDEEKPPTEFGTMQNVGDGSCRLGDTNIIAQVDKSGRLTLLTVNAPVSVDIEIKLMYSSFKAVVRFAVSQVYEYSY
ncbi:MAG: hypothetical protein K2I73_07115 [Eubacterium sp.]|nr:hypothetical protein [Eubacterium sp.]